MKFTYLIGAPGSGKTTVMRWIRFHKQVVARPVNNWLLAWMKDGERVALEIGALKLGFGGTDALSMSIIEDAIPFVRSQALQSRYGVDSLFAEGDRLANDRFFTAIRDSGYKLHLFYLETPIEVGADRRRERAERLGVKEQDLAWVTGRITKARNLAAKWNATIIKTYHPADVIAADILKEIGE